MKVSLAKAGLVAKEPGSFDSLSMFNKFMEFNFHVTSQSATGSLLENTSETYHTAYVHKATLGAMDSTPAFEILRPNHLIGDCTAVNVPGDLSVVPLQVPTITSFSHIHTL